MNYTPAFQTVMSQDLTNYLFAFYLEGEEEAKKVEERMNRSFHSYQALDTKLSDDD